LLLAAFLTNLNVSAQINPTTTFAQADLLIKQKKLNEAYSLMKRYRTAYPRDFNAAWKTAQLAYWNWDTDNAKILYELAIKLNQNETAIKFDYGKMLFEIGDYKEAEIFFTQYRTENPSSAEAWIYSIKTLYFNKELKKAVALFEYLPSSLETNTDLQTLKSEINTYRAAKIGLSMGYVNDNQPLKTLIPKLLLSKIHNSYLNWYFEGTLNLFSNDTLNGNSQIFKIGNKFTFNKLKLVADISVGTTILAAANEGAIIGGLILSKQLGNSFSLTAELTRNPYYFALPSTTNFVLQDNAGIGLSFSNFKKFSGNIQYQKQSFNDDHSISAASLWILSPGLGTGIVNAKIGYVYEGMDAEKDNFTPINSLQDLIANPNSATSINGFYKSYFTPQNQKIHSALIALQVKPSPKIIMNLTGSYGFSATWDNPYLFLNQDLSSQFFIEKGFLSETFKPATYKAEVAYAVNRALDIGLNYNYFKTAFFTANTFLFNLNYKIISER
jgi:hypothetical protein